MSGEGNTSSQSVDALPRELYKFCQSESLSEDGLREIIERHKVAPNDPRVTNNNYVFFHEACRNGRLTEGILRILLEYFPNAASDIDDKYGNMPLHDIFDNRYIWIGGGNSNDALGMVQLLIDASPQSLRHENIYVFTPLHKLCYHKNVDEEVAMEILKLLLERCPESVQHADKYGLLPIHHAAIDQSPEFCRILVDAYPRSVRMTDTWNCLPFHWACGSSNIAKVKYLYQLYPESINMAVNNGRYPIHFAIVGPKKREDNPEAVIEVVQFLLDCNPNVALQKLRDKLPLYYVCVRATYENTPKLNAYLKILQKLYDIHPEAIESNEVVSNIGSFCEEVQTYINAQLYYARQARDLHLMHSLDENGQLPLHKALCENTTITLGSIKLLVNGNPSAVRCADNKGMMPLHLACQHQKTASIIEYLIGLNEVTLGTTDEEGNTVLHYACCGGNHVAIALLLDNYGSMSVSKRNAKKQLPIHLLLESDDVSGRDDIKYVESVYLLMRAHPETIMNSI